jgi:predicted metalloprotease with PDZ domain
MTCLRHHRFVAALAALWAALAVSAAATAAPARQIAYTLSPEIRDGALTALRVTVRLRAEPEGVTRFALPDSAAGATELWRNFRDLQVEGAETMTEDGPAARIVRARPGAPLTLHYRVVSAVDHDPGPDGPGSYQPTVRPRWFWGYGEALFLRPSDDDKYRARFAWTDAPKGFPFASDLEHPASGGLKLDDLLESVSVGGPDMALFRRDAAGATVRIAVIGRFGFANDTFVDSIARVIAGERAFWGGREGPFLVALAPLTAHPPRMSIQGEGRGDAFAIQASADAPTDPLVAVVGHEYFHTWNPARLGGAYDGDREPAAYWFSEGFTDFYARRLLLRMGAFNLEQFAAAWNLVLAQYAGSSVRTAPGELIVTDFWKNDQVKSLPYQRGAILAATWDRRLREASTGRVGMDDVMRAMRDRAGKPGATIAKSPDLFVEVAKGFGLDVRDDLARFVRRGEPTLLPEHVFGSCLQVQTLDLPIFERGYAVDSKTSVITGVVSGSPAYVAGLRNGMTLVKREGGAPADPRVPYVLRVRDGQTEQVFTFRPEGKARMTLQEVVVPPNLTPERRAACAVEAAG